MPNDYGYFGKGSTGYAHYQQTFNRCFGSGSGGGDNGGCLTAIGITVVACAVVLLFVWLLS